MQIPAGTTPETGDGKELDIDIRINDEADKGGFLTPEAEVKITVNYIAVQPHGQFTADKAAGCFGRCGERDFDGAAGGAVRGV